MTRHNTAGLREVDPAVAGIVDRELRRQRDGLELIASENFASRAVSDAMGTPLTNKYAEGYPGRRYYGPVQKVNIDGQVVTLIALPAIFQQFRDQGKLPGDSVTRELLSLVEVYNPVPAAQEANYITVLEQAYAAFCAKENAR